MMYSFLHTRTMPPNLRIYRHRREYCNQMIIVFICELESCNKNIFHSYTFCLERAFFGLESIDILFTDSLQSERMCRSLSLSVTEEFLVAQRIYTQTHNHHDVMIRHLKRYTPYSMRLCIRHPRPHSFQTREYITHCILFSSSKGILVCLFSLMIRPQHLCRFMVTFFNNTYRLYSLLFAVIVCLDEVVASRKKQEVVVIFLPYKKNRTTRFWSREMHLCQWCPVTLFTVSLKKKEIREKHH